MPLIGTLAALTVVTLWGLNFLAVKIAVTDVPPIAVSALRFGSLAIVLSPFLRVRRDVLGRIVHYALAMGIGHFTTLFIALKYLDISTAGIVLQTGTPFLVMLAWLMLGESFGIWRAAGMGLAFGGIVVLVGVPAVGPDPVALAVIVLSSFMWAYGTIRAKQIPNIHPFTLIAWLAVIATPVIALLSWLFEDGQIAAIQATESRFWFSFAYLTVGSSIVAYGIWFWALRRYDVTAMAPFNLLTPLIAVGCGVAFLGDTLTPAMVVGGLMILGGVGLITTRQIVVARRARRARVAPAVPGAPS